MESILGVRALSPSPFDQGDPYVVRVPRGVASGARYYVYTTGEGGRSDRAFSVFASDFVDDPPLGTGLMIAGVSEDLRRLVSKPSAVARASADWQLYDPTRAMPWKSIPGVDWSKDRVRWYCMEGPCGGITSPRGRS